MYLYRIVFGPAMKSTRRCKFASSAEAGVAAGILIQRMIKESEIGLKVYRREDGYFFRKEEKELKVAAMLEDGSVRTLDEGYDKLKKDGAHRKPLTNVRISSDEYVEQLTAAEFQGLFRMDKVLFDAIYDEVAPLYTSRLGKAGKKSTPVVYVLRATLRWLAGGANQDIEAWCGMRRANFELRKWKMIDALLQTFYSKEVKMPTTEEERAYLSDRFASKTGIVGILGAIDGLLVRINLPRNTINARPFHCYKSFYALNCQAVAGPDAEFLYVNVGHAGASGDGFASRDSSWWTWCESNLCDWMGGYFFLGDGAYSLMPWLLTPFEGAHGRDTPPDVYNYHLSKGRQVIERAFGIMMKRWRILLRALEFHDVERMVKVIKVCCMLHNMCTRHMPSKRVRVCAVDLGRAPFDYVGEFKNHGVVEKIRVHVDGYLPEEFEEDGDDVVPDPVLQEQAAIKRLTIMTCLHDAGKRRLEGVERGHKRAAAYQCNKV